MPKLMNIQMELRKCCNHPFLINGVEQNEMVSKEDCLNSVSVFTIFVCYCNFVLSVCHIRLLFPYYIFLVFYEVYYEYNNQ
jgi:hypothetical protein